MHKSGICCGQVQAWGYEEKMPILKKAGFKSVEDITRRAVGFSSNACQDLPPQLRLSATSNEQRVWVFVPNAQELHLTTQLFMQECLHLVDWKGLELLRNQMYMDSNYIDPQARVLK